MDSVQCAADPTQDYALYLPTHYSPAKTWPIIYIFDPFAHGKAPVQLYKESAEKYGYILAASNNSRNFQTDPISKPAQSMWDDTHTRFALDPRRIYMMGLSGGARVATTLAVLCKACAVAGVIAHGAGYPASMPPSDKDRLAYFAFIGEKDFNWPEIMELRRKKEEWGAPFRMRVFAGGHQWAPPAIFGEAVEWLQLKAMQAGSAAPDASLIDPLFARTQKEAEDALLHKDAIAQFEAYRSLAADFSGLKDVTQYQEKLAALRNSAELKQALKKEQEAIDKQRSITGELSAKLAQVADADFNAQQALVSAIADGMAALKNQADHARKEETRLICTRAFNDLWVQGIEAGQAELAIDKHFGKAESYFQLMNSVSPKEPWPVLLLAESSAVRGDKKAALRYLHEAVKRGLTNPDFVDENANLRTLRSEPEFQQIVAGLKARREAQTSK